MYSWQRPHIFSRTIVAASGFAVCSNLVAKHSNAACQGNLVGTEPNRGQVGRDAQDENLGHGREGLSNEAHPEPVRSYGEHLDPCPRTGPQRTDDRSQPHALQQKNNKRFVKYLTIYLPHPPLPFWQDSIYFPFFPRQSE